LLSPNNSFFSNLSAKIPLQSKAAIPQVVRAIAFSNAYSDLKAGKLRPKNTQRKAAIIMPLEFLNPDAIKTFFAQGSLKTQTKLSKKFLKGSFF